jgi:hypothetical protein
MYLKETESIDIELEEFKKITLNTVITAVKKNMQTAK